ncbi:DUF6153 family protein [Streptomyces sp. 2A115]|uniref:DUF6153 family protein n=1 Tax=Streptomyces sp. 2A115 TaxID=3457439 RepID=UPI003FD17468
MAIRAAHGGGSAVRWAYGAFLTLCVVLVVLVHHETPMADVSSMRGSAHAAHAMATESPQVVADGPEAVSGTAAHGADAGSCGMPGMQHCTTASVDSVQLALPGQSQFDPLAYLRQDAAERAPAGVVGRAPPDLSVLCQLRI